MAETLDNLLQWADTHTQNDETRLIDGNLVGPSDLRPGATRIRPAPVGSETGVVGGVEGQTTPGQLEPGNIDLNNRPQVQTPDDTASTETGTLAGNNLPATPAPDTAPALDKLDNWADQKLAETGTKYIPPDLTKLDTPDDQYHAVQAVQDVAAGFNYELAKVLSLPNETIDKGLALLGMDLMEKGHYTKETVATLNRMGIPTYEVETLANKVGREALPALATWAAIQAAAPAMAAQQGVSVFGYLGREVGGWAMKHPFIGALFGQTSSAGSEIAKDVTGSNNPLVEFGGGLAGGVAGGGLAGTAKLGARVAKTAMKPIGMGINAISEALPPSISNVVKQYNPLYQKPIPKTGPTESLIDQAYDPKNVQNFAQNQVEGAQIRQEQAVIQAIDSVPTTGNPSRIQQMTHKLLTDAEKISKRIVSSFWDKVPTKTRIAVLSLRNNVGKLKAELVDQDNVRPDEMIAKITNVSSTLRDPDTGRLVKAAPTIQKLRDLQSQIGTQITEERAKDAPREGWVRNMVRLSEMIDDQIAEALPNNTSIAQARAMSKKHNDLFSRGPINDILSKRRTGDYRVTPGESVDKLVDKPEGIDALQKVRDEILQYPAVPTTKFRKKGASNFSATPEDKDALDKMVQGAEDSIRATFRDVAEQGGPEGAVKYVNKNGAGIKGLANVSAQLEQAAVKVQMALDQKKQIEKSALARFAQADPDKAIARIFNDVNPAKVAKELMVHFRGDKEAMDGLRSGILQELIFNRASSSPNKLRGMLDTSKFGALIEQVLDSDQLSRLNKITNTAIRLEKGTDQTLRSKLGTPLIFLSRVFGARLGSHVAHSFGGKGNIQIPGAFAQAAAKRMEQILKATPPSDMLTLAVVDPRWEQLLYSRIPRNTKEMKTTLNTYRRLFNALDTGRHQALDRFSKEQDK